MKSFAEKLKATLSLDNATQPKVITSTEFFNWKFECRNCGCELNVNPELDISLSCPFCQFSIGGGMNVEMIRRFAELTEPEKRKSQS